jgi:hypothetical protein
MKIKALLLVVSIVSLLVALVSAAGVIATRSASNSSGIIVEANVKPRPPHWF